MAKILIVDDEDRRRARFCQLFEDEDHHVVGARSYREAMGCLQSCDPPDVVIVRVGAHNGEGLETFSCIQRCRPGLPIILSGPVPKAIAGSVGEGWAVDSSDLGELKGAVGAVLRRRSRTSCL